MERLHGDLGLALEKSKVIYLSSAVTPYPPPECDEGLEAAEALQNSFSISSSEINFYPEYISQQPKDCICPL